VEVSLQLAEANYGFPAGGGVGAQVIAIVDVYGAPGSTFLNDLTTFSLSPSNSTLGDNTLPVPTVSAAPAAGQFTFTTVIATPTGKAPSLDPITLASWAAETDLDIEWAHAIAPYATIELFQAASEKISDEMFAVNKAAMAVQAAGGGVVSMSFGTTGEFQGESVYDDSIFYNSKYGSVSFVASAGDTAGQDSWPAMSPYVTSVGGTRLIQALPVDAMGNPTTPYIETPWVNTGGGTSALEPIPTYQNGVAIGTYPIRTTSFDPTGTALTSRSGPDVSLLADPGTGVAIFESNAEDEFGYTGWANVGGTSLSAPMFAGMVALANQQRHINGLAPLGGNLNPAIYVIASFEYTLPPSVPTAAPIQQNNAATLDGQRGMASLGPSYGPFYDIGGATDVTGFKAAPSQGKGALPGFDLVSGWGSPNLEGLDGLVPDAATAQSAAALDIIDLSNIVTGGLTQPIYVPATSAAGASANLIVTGQSYADHSTPPTGSSSPVDIFKGNGSATINPGNTLSLNFFIKDAGAVNTFTFAANAPTNPIPLTEVNPDLFTFGLEYTATGTAAGDLFWIEGTVKINKNNTISVGGDSFRIQGLDFNGNPIPWGKNGPGGAGGDFEIQFTTT
jgi:subtilase family serine protease